MQQQNSNTPMILDVGQKCPCLQNYHLANGLFVCFVALRPKSTDNSYGHGGTVSSPNHTFSWASFNKQLTSTSFTYFRL